MNYSQDFIRELVKKWAPINYQYINLRSWKNYKFIKQDLIVPVNLQYYKQNTANHDISYDTRDMRQRLRCVNIESLTPVAYYSFAATKNHFYLLYSFFHADDTTHPNDMEGCLIILERNDDEQKLLGMITIAHGHRPKYTYKNNLFHNNGKKDKIDPMYVETEDGHIHPIIQQESGKHGLYGLGFPWILTKIWRWFKDIFGQKSDIIVYFPYKSAKKYSIRDLIRFKNTTHYATFYYDLIDILDKDHDGLIHRRVKCGKEENTTFNIYGKFHGDAANPPWLWKIDDVYLWDRPAELAEKWFIPYDGGKPFRDEQSPPIGNINYERIMDG